MFCGNCGYWSVERLGVGLARPCCKVPSAFHAIALRYLHKGTVPYRGQVVATAAGQGGSEQLQQLCVVGVDTESEDEDGHLADSEGGDEERWLEAGASRDDEERRLHAHVRGLGEGAWGLDHHSPIADA